AKDRQHDRIVGGGERKRGARVTGFSRALQQKARGRDIALGDELLPAIDEEGDPLALELHGESASGKISVSRRSRRDNHPRRTARSKRAALRVADPEPRQEAALAVAIGNDHS